MNRSDFKFKVEVRVRNFEVDWQGIVHNAIYLHYFETGRIEYLKRVGVMVDMNSIRQNSKVVLVRNEVNYKVPARFDQLLNVYSRVSVIRNSSFLFEGLIEDSLQGHLIADNLAYHVWLDPENDSPVNVPEHFRIKVREFEGSGVQITGPF